MPALVRAAPTGELTVVNLDGLPVTSFVLDDAPAPDDERQDIWVDGTDETSEPREFNGIHLDVARVPARRSTITDLAWVDGVLLVAGLSNEEFSSRLRRVPYPFDGSAQSTLVEIYHVDHGKYETEAPIRSRVHPVRRRRQRAGHVHVHPDRRVLGRGPAGRNAGPGQDCR